MWAAFFIRVRPASRNAKPACMNITRIAVTTTQIVFAAIRRSALLMPPPRVACPVRWWRRCRRASSRRARRRTRCRCARRRRPRGDRAASASATTKVSSAFGRKRDSNMRPRYSCVIPRSRPWPTASTTVTPTWPVCSSTASITVSTRSRRTTASTLIMPPPRFVVPAGPRRARRRAAGRSAPAADARKPKRCSSPRLGSFSGKTPVWSVQMPARSELATTPRAAPCRRPGPARLRRRRR